MSTSRSTWPRRSSRNVSSIVPSRHLKEAFSSDRPTLRRSSQRRCSRLANSCDHSVVSKEPVRWPVRADTCAEMASRSQSDSEFGKGRAIRPMPSPATLVPKDRSKSSPMLFTRRNVRPALSEKSTNATTPAIDPDRQTASGILSRLRPRHRLPPPHQARGSSPGWRDAQACGSDGASVNRDGAPEAGVSRWNSVETGAAGGNGSRTA